MINNWNNWDLAPAAPPNGNVIVAPNGWAFNADKRWTVPMVAGKNAYSFDPAKSNVHDDFGAPGQNQFDPASLFGNHQLLQVALPDGSYQLWDPSYGLIYAADPRTGFSALDDFAQQSLYNYYTTAQKKDGTIYLSVVKPTGNSPAAGLKETALNPLGRPVADKDKG